LGPTLKNGEYTYTAKLGGGGGEKIPLPGESLYGVTANQTNSRGEKDKTAAKKGGESIGRGGKDEERRSLFGHGQVTGKRMDVGGIGKGNGSGRHRGGG